MLRQEKLGNPNLNIGNLEIDVLMVGKCGGQEKERSAEFSYFVFQLFFENYSWRDQGANAMILEIYSTKKSAICYLVKQK
jgi:hypothetical protein